MLLRFGGDVQRRARVTIPVLPALLALGLACAAPAGFDPVSQDPPSDTARPAATNAVE